VFLLYISSSCDENYHFYFALYYSHFILCIIFITFSSVSISWHCFYYSTSCSCWAVLHKSLIPIEIFSLIFIALLLLLLLLMLLLLVLFLLFLVFCYQFCYCPAVYFFLFSFSFYNTHFIPCSFCDSVHNLASFTVLRRQYYYMRSNNGLWFVSGDLQSVYKEVAFATSSQYHRIIWLRKKTKGFCKDSWYYNRDM
jgi:hypothetical protein